MSKILPDPGLTDKTEITSILNDRANNILDYTWAEMFASNRQSDLYTEYIRYHRNKYKNNNVAAIKAVNQNIVLAQTLKTLPTGQSRAATLGSSNKTFVGLNTINVTSRIDRGGTDTHDGLDISVPIGTPIHAIADGLVLDSGYIEGWGQHLFIEYTDLSTTVASGPTFAIYGHLRENPGSKHQKVKAGQIIAYSGNTGTSIGPHLHLEIWSGAALRVAGVGLNAYLAKTPDQRLALWNNGFHKYGLKDAYRNAAVRRDAQAEGFV